jgi:hypothetical protein
MKKASIIRLMAAFEPKEETVREIAISYPIRVTDWSSTLNHRDS